MLVGSPGVGVDSAGDLGDGNVWVGLARFDLRRLLRVARAQPARPRVRRHALPHRRHLRPLELLQRGLGVASQHRPDRRRVPGRGERERWPLLGTWRSGSRGWRCWPAAAARRRAAGPDDRSSRAPSARCRPSSRPPSTASGWRPSPASASRPRAATTAPARTSRAATGCGCRCAKATPSELLRQAEEFWRERGRSVRVVEPHGRLPGRVRDRRSGLDVRAPAVPGARRGDALRRHALPARSAGLTTAADTLGRVDERALAERLITYDTSSIDGLRAAAGFVKGWLEAREIDVEDHDFNGLPVLTADDRAARRARRVVLHGHLDVVPGRAEQFRPRVEGDRLIGRGAYDMKGALAAMMCALHDVADRGRGCACASCARPTRSPRTSTRARRTRWCAGASSATSRSPASRPACTSASRPRACWRAGSWSAAAPPTARRRGWATTRC